MWRTDSLDLPTVETRSQGAEWHPTVKLYHNVDFQELRNRLAAATPGNEELLRLCEVQKPPQSWFEEEDDPFTPD